MRAEHDPLREATILDLLRSYCLRRAGLMDSRQAGSAVVNRWRQYAARFEMERDDVIRAHGLPPFCGRDRA